MLKFENLHSDVLKLIALHLDWLDILNLSKANKKCRSIHCLDFWKRKVYKDYSRDLVVYDNYFCSYLCIQNYWIMTKKLKGYDTVRRLEPEEENKEKYIKNGYILAKYLKYKYPEKYKLIVCVADSINILSELNLIPHNLVYIIFPYIPDRLYFINNVNNNVDENKYTTCIYREDDKEIEPMNAGLFGDFMEEYELYWENVKWLYTNDSEYKFVD